ADSCPPSPRSRARMVAVADAQPTTPEQITAAVLGSFDGCADRRLGELMLALVRHLHAFVEEGQLTPAEWQEAIDVLTRTGQITDEHRQEWVLWSDSLGVSMLVDAVAHQLPAGATESTVRGPFYVQGSPLREKRRRHRATERRHAGARPRPRSGRVRRSDRGRRPRRLAERRGPAVRGPAARGAGG